MSLQHIFAVMDRDVVRKLGFGCRQISMHSAAVLICLGMRFRTLRQLPTLDLSYDFTCHKRTRSVESGCWKLHRSGRAFLHLYNRTL